MNRLLIIVLATGVFAAVGCQRQVPAAKVTTTADSGRDEFVQACVAVELAQSSAQFISHDDMKPFSKLCGEIFDRPGGREWFFGRLQGSNPELASAFRDSLLD